MAVAVPNLTTNLTNYTATQISNNPETQNVVVQVFARFWDLVAAPFHHPHMQWIILPLLLTFILSEFYFFRHTDEELGWNAALVNSLVLVFVAIDLIKTVFNNASPVEVAKLFGTALMTGENFSMFIIIIFIGGLGLGLAVVNYFHMLPRKMAYQLSSHPPINFIAYFAIVMVYSRIEGDPIPLHTPTVIAAVLLFVLVLIAIFSVQRLIGTKNASWYNRE